MTKHACKSNIVNDDENKENECGGLNEKLTKISKHLTVIQARNRDLATLGSFARAYTNCRSHDRYEKGYKNYVEEIDALRFIHRTLEAIAENAWTDGYEAIELTDTCLALAGAQRPSNCELDDL